MNCPCEECPSRFACYTSRENEEVPFEVLKKIHEAIGEATMCWQYPERAGKFESEKAIKISFILCSYLKSRVRKWQ